MSDYAITRTSPHGLDETEARLRTALADVGFGILTEIDVRNTLKKKLDLDFPPYRILGACNPKLASRGLVAEPELGTLMPCNVCVYEKDGKTIVSAMRPVGALALVHNKAVAALAAEAEGLLTQALDRALAKEKMITG